MAYFPIKIKMVDTEEVFEINKPEELPRKYAFKIIQITENEKPVIVSTPNGPRGGKNGTLSSQLAAKDISKKLGFDSNNDTDPTQTKFEWLFTIDGHQCAIWDFKGSRWSTFGNAAALTSVFGDDYSER